MEETFEQIATNLSTYWDRVDGNLPEWKELPAEDKIAYLANFGGGHAVEYPRFVAGVETMLRICGSNGYERQVEGDLGQVCRDKYDEAMAWHDERRAAREASREAEKKWHLERPLKDRIRSLVGRNKARVAFLMRDAAQRAKRAMSRHMDRGRGGE